MYVKMEIKPGHLMLLSNLKTVVRHVQHLQKHKVVPIVKVLGVFGVLVWITFRIEILRSPCPKPVMGPWHVLYLQRVRVVPTVCINGVIGVLVMGVINIVIW